MKTHLILALLLTTALSEEKLQLEDIERDNLRTESTSTSEQKQQSTYAVKSDNDNGDYHQHHHHRHQSSDDDYQHGGGLGAFTTAAPPPSTSHNNYHGDVYEQQDMPNDVEYQQEPQQIQVRPKSQPTYQDQHQHQQLYYEPEVSVGNQYQAIQQKANGKYLAKNTVYIPMSQLLAYYPHLSLNQGSPAKSELLHQLASQAAQQIPIPVYRPEHDINPSSVYTSPKLSYQIQPQYIAYASKYPLHTQAIVSSKKGVGRLYSQASQTYNQPKDLLYTQAIVTQPQTQYLQQLIYPSSLYTHVNNAQTEYVPPQQTHSEEYTHYNQPERYQYIVDTQNNVHQNYEKHPEGINVDFVPPQLPPQRFKPDQYSISGESEKLHYVQQHYITHTSQPKSLLDSYIPSHIIAAKDAERYREHPIKLESGFLPSKINFVHSYKKRKID